MINILLLGGYNSKLFVALERLSDPESNIKFTVISTKEILSGVFDDYYLLHFHKICLAFANHDSCSHAQLKSWNILKRIICKLKADGYPDEQIITFGSESHFGEYFDFLDAKHKNLLFNNHYAFDVYYRSAIISEMFPKSINLILGKTNHRLSVLNRLTFLILSTYFNLSPCSFVKSFTIKQLLEVLNNNSAKCLTISDVNYPRLRLVFLYLLFFPFKKYRNKFLNASASVIINKFTSEPIRINSFKHHNKNHKHFNLNKGARIFVVTPLKLINDDLNITFLNLSDLQKHVRFVWYICSTQKISQQLQTMFKDIPWVNIIIERYPSLYGGYNAFLSANCESTGAYFPLSAGDILFKDGFIQAISEYCKSSAFLIFCSMLKHGKWIEKKSVDDYFVDTGTHSFATGHSAGVLISLEAHKVVGNYSTYLLLAADNLFFEKIRADFSDKIVYLPDLLGYFPPGGISSENVFNSYNELLISRMHAKKNFSAELILFFWRVTRSKILKTYQ
jgi:hypothetical protein